MSNARRETPSQRMQWWMRPGPRRCWAIRKPAPSSPSRFSAGTRTSSYRISAWLPSLPNEPSIGCSIVPMSRTMFTPGVSAGTMIIEARWCGRASGSVTAMTIRKSAIEPFVENHLWPLMTNSSPSRTARVRSVVGSDPATPGSVIENADFRSPASSGSSQRSFCSGVAAIARISLLPESGAWLPNAFGASADVPSISCMSPSFTCPKPCPPRSGGRWAAHRPRSLTCSCSGRTARSKPSWPSSSNTVSIGQISSRTKSRIQSSCSWNSGSVEKSHAIAYRLLSSRRHKVGRNDPQLARRIPVGRIMKPLAALTALLALALALSAAPAGAAQTLAREAAPFIADAYGDVIAWSSYDRAAGVYRLRLLRDGQPVEPAVSPAADDLDVDVGPGPDGRPLVVYERLGDLFQYDPARGREQPLAEVNTPGIERSPSLHRDALAFVREIHGRPVVYLRRDGTTRRQPRPRYRRTLGVKSVELVSRGVFVVYRTDIVPTCCTRATLYRIVGGRLRHVFAAPSGGANLGRIVSPSLLGRNVYFGRTNEGSGQGNRFFRYDLRSKRLYSARGTRLANTLTWRGDRFLESRISAGCQGAPDDDPTPTPTCELLLTNPIHFRPAARADVRRTRP